MMDFSDAYVLRGYESIAEQTEMYFVRDLELLKGYLNGYDKDEILDLYKQIKPCICGCNNPIGLQTECMGDFDFTIICPNCERNVCRSMYDYDVTKDCDEVKLCIRDWNNGLSNEDIEKLREKEDNRIRLREEDLVWKPLYPNNMVANDQIGLYCLVFQQKNDKSIYCCKWTILFQKKEIKPMLSSSDADIDLYILFMQRFFDVKGKLSYPVPSEFSEVLDYFERNTDDIGTFQYGIGVNDYGDFIRAFRSLEEAKEGALARCGWQGLNKDTLLKVEE